MRLLLNLFSEHPEIVYKAVEPGELGEGEVEAAASRDLVSSSPSSDPQVESGEGNTADYLFVYLRSILAIIENAYAQGKTVVYDLSFE